MNRFVKKGFFLASRIFGSNPRLYEHEYNRIAPTYDDAVTRPLLSAITERAVASSPIAHGMTCVDLGCGTGDATAHILSKTGDSGSVRACDLSAQMLSKAAARLSSHTNISFENTGMESFLASFSCGSVDYIGSFWAIEYCDHRAVFREAARILKMGGHFCATVNHANSLEELQTLVTPILLKHPLMLKSIPPLNFIANSEAFEKIARAAGFSTKELEQGSCSFRFARGADLTDWMKYGGPAAGFCGSIRERRLPGLLKLIEHAVDRQNGITLTFKYSVYLGEK